MVSVPSTPVGAHQAMLRACPSTTRREPLPALRPRVSRRVATARIVSERSRASGTSIVLPGSAAKLREPEQLLGTHEYPPPLIGIGEDCLAAVIRAAREAARHRQLLEVEVGSAAHSSPMSRTALLGTSRTSAPRHPERPSRARTARTRDPPPAPARPPRALRAALAARSARATRPAPRSGPSTDAPAPALTVALFRLRARSIQRSERRAPSEPQHRSEGREHEGLLAHENRPCRQRDAPLARRDQRRERRDPARAARAGPLLQAPPQPREPTLQPRLDRLEGLARARGDRAWRPTLEVAQQDRAPERLVEPLDLAHDPLLERDALVELVVDADRLVPGGALLALLPAALGAPELAGGVARDGGEPRPRRAPVRQRPPQSGEPGLLRDVLRRARVADEAARERTYPVGVPQQVVGVVCRRGGLHVQEGVCRWRGIEGRDLREPRSAVRSGSVAPLPGETDSKGNNQMQRRMLALAAVCTWVAGTAEAQLIVPTAQDRRVEADAELGLGGGPSESEAFTATDFSPFVQQAEARVEDIPQGLLADAGAHQDSTLLPDQILAAGSYFATVENAFTEANAVNRCELDFTVTQDCVYDLSGFVESFDFGGTSIVFKRIGGQTVYSNSNTGSFSHHGAFDLRGYLPAGDYELRVWGIGWVQDGFSFEYASGAYDLDLLLSLPAAGDCVPTPNTSGNRAILGTTGEQEVGSFEFHYNVTGGPPDSFGVLFYGDAAPPTPFGSGVLCVAAPQHRVPGVQQLDASGQVFLELPWFSQTLSSGPSQILPASTWTFQFWYRDVTGTATPWNTSSALTLTFE